MTKQAVGSHLGRHRRPRRGAADLRLEGQRGGGAAPARPQLMSPGLRPRRSAGFTLLELMIDAVTSPEKTYSKLLIDRVSSQYNIKAPVLYERIQAVLDYISGMTDVFALDLYRKINGNSLPAV